MEEDFTVWFTVMRFEEKFKIKAKLNRKSLMAHGIELGVNHLIITPAIKYAQIRSC